MRRIKFAWDQRRRLPALLASNRLPNIRLEWDTLRNLVVLDQVETSGHCHLATLPTGAMFFSDDINYAPYAGVAGTNTPYLLAFYDSTGLLVGAGYGGAVGGGEDLTELLADTGFDDAGAWEEEAGWVVNGGASGKAVATNITSAKYVYQVIAANAGSLVKTVYTCSDYTSGNFRVVVGTAATGAGTSRSSAATFTEYLTRGIGTLIGIGYYAGTLTASMSSLSVSRVNDIPNTGLKLYSTKNGATQSLMLTGTGNVNAITKVKVYYVGD
jgi:hypothetical protein